MPMQTLTLEHKLHRRVIVLAKHLSYAIEGGWAVVLFDSNNDYYSPSDVFASQEEADAWAKDALKNGIHIS